MEDQLSEAMGVPGHWLPQDWQWRPSWVDEARLPHMLQVNSEVDLAQAEELVNCELEGVKQQREGAAHLGKRLRPM
jgi:hypothetical protein